MPRKRVALVAGTRPEVIKMAPLYFALRGSTKLEPYWLSTGQHREMLDQAMAVFGIHADLDLALMQPGQNLTDLTARVLAKVGEALPGIAADALLVQGDTTSVLGAALAAFYAGLPVGHVEAGLRTGDILSPWPEEMNRRLTTPLCRWCFAPTERSAANLRAEGVGAERVQVTGNTVVDALLWVRARLADQGIDARTVAAKCQIPAAFTERFLERGGARWVLVTGHRRESFGSGFDDLCGAVRQLADRHPDLGLLYPVHLNPRVREPVNRILGDHDRIALVEPADYQSFVWLMDRCHFLLSDSGGVQEEAPSLGKPVLVTRDTTERPEGVDAGTCTLVGTAPERILDAAESLLADEAADAARAAIRNPYGDGTAARAIVATLERDLA